MRSNPSLLCTVSTVKDTWSNIEQFVEMNLASGADHMFLFLDSDDDGILPRLRSNPHVTALHTDEEYWAGTRKDQLIQRQLVNANLVNWLVTPLDSVGWLVHLDADECLEIDKERLVGLSADVRCVRLAVREAVSTERGTREVRQFKKKLQPAQLDLLVRLRVVSRPSNRLWLNGHLIGKAAVRPALDLGMGIHRTSLRGGPELPHHRAPAFRVLHYDCVSLAEFVRKWGSHLEAGGGAFRAEREALMGAVEEVLRDQSLDESARREALRVIYLELVEDPVELLEQHGLLEHWRHEWHQHEPRMLPPQDRHELEVLLPLLTTMDKKVFRQRRAAVASIHAMQDVREQLGDQPQALCARIDEAVARARRSLGV